MARPNPNERTVALIVAAGRGRRMGEALPKQFLPLAGQPILKRTIAAFLAEDWIDRVTVVINPDDRALYDAAIRGTGDDRLSVPVPGGATRAASVRLGLEALAAPAPDRVLIHDAARPFVSADLIAQVACALDEADGAFAARSGGRCPLVQPGRACVGSDPERRDVARADPTGVSLCTHPRGPSKRRCRGRG